ncbi:major facilitator superfamily domain-containing protein [Clohesyomyces aquaticus]|uniref:Major facilitator superfamily domain-containing protein n=1 Tax=Clohesyomyces aquaticus TaxID=1231657 RepID=A0A1Y1Y7B0_9PLEO|nr:major facilitator superfamily domain-containing protein [Clohesyomyces aquaticus]
MSWWVSMWLEMTRRPIRTGHSVGYASFEWHLGPRVKTVTQGPYEHDILTHFLPLWRDHTLISTVDSDASLLTNVFADPEVRDYYVKLYEDSQYECRHEEERKAIRRLDWHAVSGTLLKDLKLTTNDYNWGNIMFLCLWSIVAMSQAALKGRASFLVTGSLLAVLEGGFIPDLTALSITTIVTSLLAFGIFHFHGVAGIAGWRWLFLLEALITLLIGVASDDPRKGDMHNRQAITPKRLWSAIKDYDLWPIYANGLICFVPQSPVNYYLTLSLRQLSFSTFNVQLLVIPSSVAHIITLLGITWISERLDSRASVCVWQSLWTLPCVIALYAWHGLIVNKWGTYALLTILLSYPYCHAFNVAWTSKNSNNVGSRSVSAALYNTMVQCGGIIGANIYREDDKPRYKRGNRNLIIINVLAIVLFLFAKVYYVTKNKIRDRKWNAMTREERIHYIRTTKDTASRRPDFRFAH